MDDKQRDKSVADEIRDDLKQFGDDLDKWADQMAKEVNARAEKFGGEAKKAMANLGAWSSDVEQRLRGDWERSRAAAHATWDKVRAAVKEGWENARRK